MGISFFFFFTQIWEFKWAFQFPDFVFIGVTTRPKKLESPSEEFCFVHPLTVGYYSEEGYKVLKLMTN